MHIYAGVRSASLIRIGNKNDLSDFVCCMAVGQTWCFSQLLGFSESVQTIAKISDSD